MVDVDKAIIARLKREGETFEILVDCDKALEFRSGKGSLDDALATYDIFKDVKKGEHASENELKKIFGTDDAGVICEQIIKKGEIQLTKEHMSKLRAEKRKQVIAIIHRNGIDSKTGLPHPPQRIENALEEARVNIDMFKSAEAQVQDVLEKIRPILPIRFEVREIAVKLDGNYAGKSYPILKKYGKILKEEWQNDGSWVGVVKIPAGIQDEFFSQLNNLTHGNVETKLVRSK